MSKLKNRGFEIEDRIIKIFKGKARHEDECDFGTQRTIYEVKSCNLFLAWSNQMHKKGKYQNKVSYHLGRFFVQKENHELIKKLAKEEGKVPKYIFAIVIEKNIVYKKVAWSKIGKILKNYPKELVPIKIRQIFPCEI